MALQSILRPNRRESLPAPSAGNRITRLNPRNIVQGSVERTFGWLGRCRRLAKDFEALTRTHLAFVQVAMIRLMMRRIARASQVS